MKTNDPRDEKCIANPQRMHKWVKSSRETITKAHFVQILRCRWCGHHVGLELKRVILPSGRVTITERPFKMDQEVTDGLQSKKQNENDMKQIENQVSWVVNA